MRTLFALALLARVASGGTIALIDDFRDPATSSGDPLVTDGVGQFNATRTILIDNRAEGRITIGDGRLTLDRGSGDVAPVFILRYDWQQPVYWSNPQADRRHW